MKYDFDIDFSTDNSLSLILNRIKPVSKVLEFGPAAGYMTKYMKEQLNCVVYCIEIDSASAEKAMQYCDKMIISDIDQMKWQKELFQEEFDYIVFADVLEHLRKPLEVLREARKHLKKNGTLITSIPNVGHSAVLLELLNGKFDYRSVGLLDETHIHFFTKKSILELFENSGLFPVEWLNTKMLPEQTELKSSYSSVPEHIKEFLINKEDAHVYQYISILKKIEDINESNVKQDVINSSQNNYIHSEYLQIFWDEGNGFSEINSTKVPLINGSMVKYNVRIARNIDKLRIDPSNKIGCGEINSIALYEGSSETGNVSKLIKFWTFTKHDEQLEPHNGIHRIPDGNKYTFVCTNLDPQLILSSIPHVDTDKEMYLQVEMWFSQVPTDIIESVGILIDSIKRDAYSLEIKYNNAIESYENKLSDYEKKLLTNDVKINKMKEELIQIHSLNLKLKEEFINIISSHSWRYTSWLRSLKRLVKNIGAKLVGK